MKIDYPKQTVDFLDLGTMPLRALLALEAPPGVEAARAFKQLNYVEAYALDANIGCKSVAIENHYIDRDFMEDHSVFYGRSLLPYPNHCRRVHFFTATATEVERRIRALQRSARNLSAESFRMRAKRFSERFYAGFCVIKPLSGAPVGRTVLKVFPAGSQDDPNMERKFEATRVYVSHLFGVELSVRGLGFQQQDVGVAACATTAIWTALQKHRDNEELGATTPAHITIRATQDRMPFGRSMPSEGLSIDQMSLAVQAFGVSPVLSKMDDGFAAGRATLFSASRSGLCPVLVISKQNGNKHQHHAIAVVGTKVSNAPIAPVHRDYDQAADRLSAVYIHDDRLGPYLLAELRESASGGLGLRIRVKKGTRQRVQGTGGRVASSKSRDLFQEWQVTHMLVPTHQKVRLSFPELNTMATLAAAAFGVWTGPVFGFDSHNRIRVDHWIMRSHRYLEAIALRDEGIDRRFAELLGRRVAFSRYLGVIRTRVGDHGVIDILVDSTSTEKNPSFLGVVSGQVQDKKMAELASIVALQLSCPAFVL